MKRPERPDWAGRTVVCLASGPSLTAEDTEKVRAAGHPVIVTNTTFRLAPWADVLFGMDMKWWQIHHKEVESVFTGRKVSTSHAAKAYGAESLAQCPWFPRVLNSGEGAIMFALVGKPARVVLLGYDSQTTGGMTHWHGSHPKGLGDAGSLKRWPKQFANTARNAKQHGIAIENATRQTALTCFPRVELEAAL
jgi:hypothetical protein